MAAKPTPAFDPPRQQGISLRELTEAFAEVMGGPSRSEAPGPEEPAQGDPTAEGQVREVVETDGEQAPQGSWEAPPAIDAAPADADDLCPISPRSVLEAMLFVGNRDSQPLTPQRAAELMRGVEPGEILDLVEQLNHRYAGAGYPYEIVSEGPGYRLAIRREFHPLRDQFYGRIREARLSQAAVDVLAIVAYRQPITAEDISNLRGTPSSHILAQLVRRRLLRIDRPAEKPRIARYYTTGRFLELFRLASLADLPRTEEPDGP